MARLSTFVGRIYVSIRTVNPFEGLIRTDPHRFNPFGRQPFRIEPMWVILGNPLGDGPGAPWRAPSKYWIRHRTLNNARDTYFS
jgi:hypothetical protein